MGPRALFRVVMRRPSPSSSLRSSPVLALSMWAMVGASACADVEPGPSERDPFEISTLDAAPARRIAHVKVVLRTEHDSGLSPNALAESSTAIEDSGPRAQVAAELPEPASASELDVRGDFAAFRGVEERLVWAFAGVARPAWAELDVGDCMEVDAAALRVPDEPSAEFAADREIELLDLGRFEVQVGQHRFDVPLHLAPGVLPYASGVQYRGEQALSQATADGATEGADTPALALAWEGLEALRLPAAHFEAPLLPELDLEVFPTERAEGETQASPWFDLVWSPLSPETRRSTAPRTELFLHARLAQETGNADPSSAQVVCRLSDRGEWHLDLDELADVGLALDPTRTQASPVQIELRRVHHFDRSAAGFERVQFQVERSERLWIEVPADR